MRHDRYIRRQEVMRRTSLPKSTLYSMMASGCFPRCYVISRRSVAWRESDIVNWMNFRLNSTNENQKD
jgi:prophage regulatory protein